MVLSLLVATGVAPIAVADAARGKALYAGCVACHGDSGAGNDALQAPALAGLDAVYLARQLHNFKAGIRGADAADTAGAQMRASAALLADEAAMADVAAYIASLAPVPVAPVAGADLRNGSNHYQASCGACHGGRAEGNTALFSPRLAGQHTAYLKRQYLNFREGLRGAHPDDKYGRQMKVMSAALPAAKDLDDVLGFIAAQGAAE
ncbi:MAG: c-type cytochrome [Gammaproteobacteria bacterium]|nr:c-type cytochrome [Gammaproteobacteria bacterium]